MSEDKVILLLYEKHQTWINIVASFSKKNSNINEDIVQEMYIKMIPKIRKGLDIIYHNNEINYWYIFKVLKTLHIDYLRRKKNITKIEINEDIDFIPYNDVNYDEAYEKIKNELNSMFWYNRKIFEIINEGESIADFSRNSYIEYFILYNTYKKVKKKLKKLI
tara:strand:- start:1202 stop:1690 length:489 start_codon:yes stop_codon:yes gene_type:complete